MVYDTVKSGKICFDYFTGIAAIIGACSALLGAVGVTKVLTDKYTT
jgi:hypothetical protein